MKTNSLYSFNNWIICDFISYNGVKWVHLIYQEAAGIGIDDLFFTLIFFALSSI